MDEAGEIRSILLWDLTLTAIDSKLGPGGVEVVYRLYTLEKTGWISVSY
jgi:hypothetical protein